jgi:hypothetical protein
LTRASRCFAPIDEPILRLVAMRRKGRWRMRRETEFDCASSQLVRHCP